MVHGPKKFDADDSHSNPSDSSLVLKSCPYDVGSQYRMNSEVERSEGECTRKNKKRKLNQASGVVEVEEEVRLLVNKAVVSAQSTGLLCSSHTRNDNNLAAVTLVQSLGSADLLYQLTTMPHQHSQGLDHVVLTCQQDASSLKDLFHTIVTVESPASLIVDIHNRKFILPPRSTFIMSDISGLKSFSRSLEAKFDFIVADPPWENKSIKRKGTYDTLTNYELLKMPVKFLATDSAILALWCTNKKSLHEFVEAKLLPGWGFKMASLWYWFKVTKGGEPIRPFEEGRKKSYECLIIAVRSDNDVPEQLKQKSLLVSVPSLVHSSKPPLIELFRKYLEVKPRCLELFARNLLPDFTSWGNEVLTHQDMDYYELKHSKPEEQLPEIEIIDAN